ncbi:hypothetical protein [Marinobacterium sp. BA1]|uniref:hypothetical protein n=1 Tax=Marinobacterium sp. BA1 TaxID=3138931 RepID=UPI0032E5F435
MLFYHGTDSKGKAAIDAGEPLRTPFLTTSEALAEYYAECAMDENETDDWHVLAVNLSTTDLALLRADFAAFEEPISFIRDLHANGESDWLDKLQSGEIRWPNDGFDFETSLTYTASTRCCVDIPARFVVAVTEGIREEEVPRSRILEGTSTPLHPIQEAIASLSQVTKPIELWQIGKYANDVAQVAYSGELSELDARACTRTLVNLCSRRIADRLTANPEDRTLHAASLAGLCVVLGKYDPDLRALQAFTSLDPLTDYLGQYALIVARGIPDHVEDRTAVLDQLEALLVKTHDTRPMVEWCEQYTDVRNVAPVRERVHHLAMGGSRSVADVLNPAGYREDDPLLPAHGVSPVAAQGL